MLKFLYNIINIKYKIIKRHYNLFKENNLFFHILIITKIFGNRMTINSRKRFILYFNANVNIFPLLFINIISIVSSFTRKIKWRKNSIIYSIKYYEIPYFSIFFYYIIFYTKIYHRKCRIKFYSSMAFLSKGSIRLIH